MKQLVCLLAFCVLLAPAAGVAQGAPPIPPPEPGGWHADPGVFRQLHEQMAQAHRDERAKILAALTPAHRALVASLVGQLAVAADPDPAAAAAKLDAALSPSEKKAVLGIHQSARELLHTAMEKAHAQMLASLPPDQQQQIQARMDQMHGGSSAMQRRAPSQEPSAGQLVLMTASSESGHMMMRFGPDMHIGPGMHGPHGAMPPGAPGIPPPMMPPPQGMPPPMPAPTST